MIEDAILTGGCQCGEVRYALDGRPASAEVCHCRMCQKAMGNIFAPFASVRMMQLAWTRGQPVVFQSSSVAERGFCGRCGTPLYFYWFDSDRISITIGSLDRPDLIAPRMQYGIESRVPWLHHLAGLSGTRTEDDQPAERREAFESYQHPDYDL